MRMTLWMIAGLAVALQAGCSIKATLNQTTDTTSNMTGTTSSARGWFTEDGQLRPEFKADAFVMSNQANVARDIAAGDGEYLASASRLFGVPPDRHAAFAAAAQRRYAETDHAAIGASGALLSLLRDTAAVYRP
jgi:hypothetical protein